MSILWERLREEKTEEERESSGEAEKTKVASLPDETSTGKSTAFISC